MANAMVALATITLGSAASTVTFSSIPATYRDLRLVSFVPSLTGSPTAAGAFARFNGDTGANYSTVYAYGNGSSTGSGSESTSTLFWGAFPAAGGIDHWDILDYAQTDKHKTAIGRADGNGASTWMYAGRWASTSAITSITLTAPDTGSDQFGIGSVFSLYGIVSA
jgi:hypothetical protein